MPAAKLSPIVNGIPRRTRRAKAENVDFEELALSAIKYSGPSRHEEIQIFVEKTYPTVTDMAKKIEEALQMLVKKGVLMKNADIFKKAPQSKEARRVSRRLSDKKEAAALLPNAKENLARLNKRTPICPVSYDVLEVRQNTSLASSQPVIFTGCGHVQSVKTRWNNTQCPMCLMVSRVVAISCEMQGHRDNGDLELVYNPCGHIASQETVRLHLASNTPKKCPFCIKTLDATKPTIKAFFQFEY